LLEATAVRRARRQVRAVIEMLHVMGAEGWLLGFVDSSRHCGVFRARERRRVARTPLGVWR